MKRDYNKYPDYKNSDVKFMDLIPTHWETWKVTHGFQTIGSGTTPKSDNPDFYDGDIPWITTSELREKVVTDTSQKLTKLALENVSSLKIYKPGAVAIAMYGATIGRLGILGIESTVNQACCVYDDPIKFYPKFLFYWLWMSRNTLISFSSGGGQPNLSQDDLKQLRIPIPKIEEQTQIANFLDQKTSQIDKLIEQKEKLLNLLDEKRTAIITQAVTKGLDPNVEMKDSGIDWLGEIPKHWEIKKLKFVSQITNSNVDKKTIEGQKSVKLCNYVDVYYNDYIVENLNFMLATAASEEIEKFTLKVEDVIITKDSESADDIGIPTLVVENIKDLVCGYHLSLLRTLKKELNGAFLFYFLKSTIASSYFEIYAQGVTRFGLSLNSIKSINIPLPQTDEQIRISEFLKEFTYNTNKTIDLIKDSLSKLKEYREALITAAVTGQIDVRKEVFNE